MSGYIYTTIPGPDGNDTVASQIGGINDSGTLVAFFANGTVSGEYIVSGGVYTTLSGPDGAGFNPSAEINDAGQVIGQYYPGGTQEGLIYDNGAYTALTGPDGNEETVAYAINNSGTVVGSYYNGTNNYGFIFAGGSYTELTGPPNANEVDVLPYAINSTGEIVGKIDPPATDSSVGFIYNNGTYTLLTGPDLNDTDVAAFAINDSGEALVSYNDGNGNAVAFVFNDGTYTTLTGPAQGDSFVSVVAVNAAGEIAGSATENGVRTAFTATLCFLRGTRILTPTGELPVEALSIGDRVVTRFGGVQKIKWIGRQNYESRLVKDNRDKLPVCIHPGAFGDNGPAKKLFVSPGHSLLVGDTLVLASALVNGITVTQRYGEDTPAMIEYFQIELASHDCIIAEGIFAETYADAPGLRAQFHNEAEYHALYPDEPPPEDLVRCVPRLERGKDLVAAIRPVAAIAEALVPAGRFEGWIDGISDWRIEGWAIDHDHPELPVLLEVLVGDQVIGTALACEEREDLVQVGIGNGRRAFVFIPKQRLRSADWPRAEMRRARDGAPLQMTQACRDRIGPLPLAAA